MKYILTLTFFIIPFLLYSQISFDEFFVEKSLRFDYIHAGNSENETVYFEQMKEEPFWGGSKINLIDTFEYGEYKVVVLDSASKKQIYTHGYCTLFEEWQTTQEAKSLNRSFYESVSIPFPKKTIILELYSRNENNVFDKLFSHPINPNDKFIIQNDIQQFETVDIFISGESEHKVDIVFIPDGYTLSEIEKFKNDATNFKQYLFNSSPYKENSEKFNIRAILAPSIDSGTDLPGKHIWKNTIANTSFYTFDSERYLMTYDYKTVKDIAANVPYDQIIIIVNSEKYGGGGIYNFYSTFSANSEDAEFLFIHEFGHAFAGLGDEYYDSDVAYETEYSKEFEPWQPNLTNLSNFNTKWESMIDKRTPIPTPVEKKYIKAVGVYEGGGYLSKGIYRPYIDCTMKSVIVDSFCPVCKTAIFDMIQFYSK